MHYYTIHRSGITKHLNLFPFSIIPFDIHDTCKAFTDISSSDTNSSNHVSHKAVAQAFGVNILKTKYYSHHIVSLQSNAHAIAVFETAAIFVGEHCSSRRRQLNRWVIVCISPQLQVSGSLLQPHLRMLMLDLPIPVRRRFSVFQVVYS